jgi:hypothetical protein
MLRFGKEKLLYNLYFSKLFGREKLKIQLKDTRYDVKILRINENGSIVLKFNNGTDKTFWFKEFETIIE